MNQGLLWPLLMECISKICEELEDDGALLFGYIFMAYLDIGGGHQCHLPFNPRVWILLSRKFCESLPM